MVVDKYQTQMEFVNKILKDLETNRKKHLNAIKLIQEEIKHFGIFKKLLRNNHE